MIKVAAFLTNINSPNTKTHSWQKTNLESLTKYFKRHNIPFYIIDNNTKYVDQIISNNLSVDLCKILMINEFLSTNIDYGIFLNTSTSIINVHSNVKDVIDFDTQYFSRMEMKDIDNSPYLISEKINKIKYNFQTQMNEKSKSFFISDTSFMGLNKYFCEDYLDYLNKAGLNLKNDNALKNLRKYPNSEYIEDSFLLEAFMQYNYKKYNVQSLYKTQINNIILDNTMGRDDITLEDIMYYYPIFFCQGDINHYSHTFVKHGLLKDIGLEEYNKIRHLRYSEMFYKHHSK
jgi:hypothetical protein